MGRLELASPLFAAIRRSKHRKYRVHALSTAALRRVRASVRAAERGVLAESRAGGAVTGDLLSFLVGLLLVFHL